MEDTITILKSLGPNKVTISFVEDPDFVQGPPLAKDVCDPFSLFPSPEMKGRRDRHNDVKPGPPNPTKPNVIPPKEQPDSPSPKSFIKAVMLALTPIVSVLMPAEQEAALTKFKHDLALNLSNEKQLFKAFGFSRKRGVTVEGMQREIEATKSDDTLMPTDALLQYLVRLLKSNVAIIDKSQTKRADILCPDTDKWTLMLFTEETGFTIATSSETKHDMDAQIVEMMRQHINTPSDISTMKMSELRSWAQFLMGSLMPKGATKAQLVDDLTARLRPA